METIEIVKIFILLLSKYFSLQLIREDAMPASLHLKVWTVIAYVVVTTLIAIWLHEGMAPAATLMATGSFG